MGIGSRRAVTGAATALLLCLMTAGTASAQEAPTDSAASDSAAISGDQTTDVNDRQGWEDTADQPLGEDTPTMCDRAEVWYTITSKQAYQIPSWWNGTKYKDGPGGTIAVSVLKGGTISADVTASAGVEGEADLGAIVLAAKTSVSFKIGGSVTITTGHNYTHDISRNKYGHLQYGSWGYKTTWKKWRSNSGSSCKTVEIGHGTAVLPTSETGWKYWETSS